MSKANLVTPRTLAGFMELMPRDQLAFERIRQALEEYNRQGRLLHHALLLGCGRYQL